MPGQQNETQIQIDVGSLSRQMSLTNLTLDIDLDKKMLTTFSVHRPALQLAGYFGYFDAACVRLQLVGRMEQSYMSQMPREDLLSTFEKIAAYDVPCIIFTTGFLPDKEIVDICAKHNIPVLLSKRKTTDLMTECSRWLRVVLAPSEIVHGVLMDLYGEGVLIMGESGLGKSEAALELIKRGHRFVADDLVLIRKVSDVTLVGSATSLSQDFIELRGIGFVDVRSMFGVESIKLTQEIDMVIKLSEYDPKKQYDRMGQERNPTLFMGVELPCYEVPLRVGRNIAVICECAAISNRARKMGYNASAEFLERRDRLNDPLKKQSE